MELIIKPTSACNFKCKFCAASELNIPTLHQVPAMMASLIYDLKPTTIIVTGGEPFMCPPSFYRELISVAKDIDATISITSNLWQWYKERDRWKKSGVLDNSRVEVGTSFNYGDTRGTSKEVFTEERFEMVLEAFNEDYGYKPTFIGVIDQNNVKDFDKHLDLCAKHGISCKLNAANAIGNQKTPFSRPDLMREYLRIIKEGKEDLEQNCRDRVFGSCPFNTNFMCRQSIRAIYRGADSSIYWSYCEELLNLGIGKKLCDDYGVITEEYEKFIKATNPEPTQPTAIISSKCYYCELYRLCNGCAINQLNAIRDPKYCEKMLNLKDEIIDSGWKI